MKKTKNQHTLPVVRTQVKSLLARSAAFRSLPSNHRREITRDMTKVANYLAAPGANAGAELVGDVDFPDFVADLLENVFEANLNTALEQMEAYSKLLAAASKSVDQFTKKTLTDKEAFDYLSDQVPDYSQFGASKKKRARVRLATGRQQVLATMVLMGINRIVVTQGTIEATVKFKRR